MRGYSNATPAISLNITIIAVIDAADEIWRFFSDKTMPQSQYAS
jgi:hypothetical protein